MSELKELLDREASRVGADPSALSVVYRTAERRQRTRRIATIASALVIFAAVVAAFFVALASSRSMLDRPATYDERPGDIVVRASTGRHEGAIVDIDPTTGAESPLPVVAAPKDLVWSRMGAGHRTDLSSSPDGRALAYLWGGDIWVLDVPRGTSLKIVDGCGNGCTVAWAPDGSAIAFADANSIELVSTDGTGRTTVTNLPGVSLQSWSPDGQRLLALYHGRLYTIGRDGSDLRSLDVRALSAAWSPDGTRVAYIFPTECDHQQECVVAIGTVGADGAAPTELARAGKCLCLGFSPGIAWSPDGSQLALVAPAPAGQPSLNLYVVDADGTDLRLLREDAWGRPTWRTEP